MKEQVHLTRRVVVTGVGLVCALGIGTEESWKNLVAGRSGVSRITHFDTADFDCQIAGEVKNFDPFQWIEKKELKKMGRFIQMALAAADFAVKMAEWKPEQSDLDEVGVYVASGIGGFDIIEREHIKLMQGGPGKISPFFIPSAIVNLASGPYFDSLWSKRAEFRDSDGLLGLGTFHRRFLQDYRTWRGGDDDLRRHRSDDYAHGHWRIRFDARAIDTKRSIRRRASRPFDAARDGFVVGEGAGILLLESLEHAQKRNAPILAEIVGYGMSGDAYHITQPAENGDGAFRVMRAALKDAKLSPDDIGYVNAHGTSTPIGDVIETTAMKRLFGERAIRKKLAVSSTKSMTGHLLGGAGGLEAGISVLALRDQILPPTINQETPDPECDLDYVPNVARKATVDYALSNSFGFGGTNAALIFKRWAGK